MSQSTSEVYDAIRGVQEQHDFLENRWGECDGTDWISHIEDYYIRRENRPRAARAIMTCGQGDVALRRHMLLHVRTAVYVEHLRERARQGRAPRKFGVEAVLAGEQPRYRSALFTYGLRRNGSMWKQRRSTGRLEPLSLQEQRQQDVKMNLGVRRRRQR